ncbi:S-ribosylhomocysteinase [Helicobacter pylori NY40]|uniref:S-ribosylhomocysteine lyase n=1 Tax=Helicobacter pylori NY40 TaxID=1426844 RepID=A0A060Q0P8_HELPX|nr:S-ribosylhomocysteinase [Helicobacter pylori NY40]
MKTPKMNVESFNLDHTKVKAPYVRIADRKKGVNGDVIVKYDVRFKQPNQDHMDMPSLHSLEHLVAEIIRNHANYVVDWSPMSVGIEHEQDLLEDLEQAFAKIG